MLDVTMAQRLGVRLIHLFQPLHRKPVPGQLKRLPGVAFCPGSGALGPEAAFSENAAKLQKSYNFLIKKAVSH